MLISKEATIEEGVKAPCTGLAADVLPAVQLPQLAENLQRGVSTRNAPLPKAIQEARRAARTPHWYALRTTYGREKKAYEYLCGKNLSVFYPTRTNTRLLGGKRIDVVESILPNMLFVFSTEEELKTYVYDNVNLPYVRFYYRHYHKGAKLTKTPLIIPDAQMESLKIICSAQGEDVLITTRDIPKFQTGQLVRIITGNFSGVEGRVARYQGQQRVAVVIEGLLTVVTAYVPTAFLKVLL